MEIALFWQRSNYFLALNTAVAVGFFAEGVKDYQIYVGVFGLIVSFLWLRINNGSKYWQSRWEGRLKKAEENLNLNIEYFSASKETTDADVKESLDFSKHGNIRKFFDSFVLNKPSVSFTMMLLSILFMVLWGVLICVSVYNS